MTPLYSLGWVFFRSLGLSYLRCHYHNAENVPSTGPGILASNHASFLDPPLVGAGFTRDLNYLGRESLFRFPPVAAVLKRVHVVPVNREGGGAAGLRAILDRLLAGNLILVFPEGTRTPDGQIRSARSGIGLTVVKSSAPIIPVRLFGTFEVWNRSMTWPRPGRVDITYGQPLRFESLREEARTCSKTRLRAIYQGITDQVMDAIRQLQPFTKKYRFP